MNYNRSARVGHVVAALMLAAGLVWGAACSVSSGQNDCNVGALVLRDGGVVTTTGGGAADGGQGGEGGGAACLCPLPINFIPECRAIVFTAEGVCEERPYANFAACRSGVGLCFGGVCNAPNWAAQCQQAPAGPPWVDCHDVGDCDDGNPCTSDSCPDPGCGPCLHVPVADLTDCTPPAGSPMLCRQGACCDVPAGFSPP